MLSNRTDIQPVYISKCLCFKSNILFETHGKKVDCQNILKCCFVILTNFNPK